MNDKYPSIEKELDLIIGARLKALRIAKGLSQTELGLHVGISFQQVQKCERGHNRIGAGRLWQFCQALGVNPDNFYDEINSLQNKQPHQVTESQQWSRMLSRQNFKLVQNFSLIVDYAHKISLLRICEGLAHKPDELNSSK